MPFVLCSDAAILLGISDDTVRRRVKAGTMRSCEEEHTGRLMVWIGPEVVAGNGAGGQELALLAPAEGSWVTQAVHLHNLLAERDERIRILERELEARRSEAGDLLELAKSMIPPRAWWRKVHR